MTTGLFIGALGGPGSPSTSLISTPAIRSGRSRLAYGGNKQSGLGREGLRFAIEDMTNIQMIAIRTNPPT